MPRSGHVLPVFLVSGMLPPVCGGIILTQFFVYLRSVSQLSTIVTTKIFLLARTLTVNYCVILDWRGEHPRICVHTFDVSTLSTMSLLCPYKGHLHVISACITPLLHVDWLYIDAYSGRFHIGDTNMATCRDLPTASFITASRENPISLSVMNSSICSLLLLFFMFNTPSVLQAGSLTFYRCILPSTQPKNFLPLWNIVRHNAGCR